MRLDQQTLSAALRQRSNLVDGIAREFCPRFVPEGKIVFLSTAPPNAEARDLAELLSIVVAEADTNTLPDVVIHDVGKDWLFAIDAVAMDRVPDERRQSQFLQMFRAFSGGLVFVNALADRAALQEYGAVIPWETSVWIASDPDHLIHFNGARSLGPYPHRD